jgi:DNA repair protein RecN (Recombination protein N)
VGSVLVDVAVTFVSHQLATTTLLKSIQPHIIDLHGQGDQQSLLAVDSQLQLLDSYANAGALRIEVRDRFDSFLCRFFVSWRASRHSDAERLQTLDLLHFQVTELEQALLRPGEDQNWKMSDESSPVLVGSRPLATNRSSICTKTRRQS